jgi:hypothetical protein
MMPSLPGSVPISDDIRDERPCRPIVSTTRNRPVTKTSRRHEMRFQVSLDRSQRTKPSVRRAAVTTAATAILTPARMAPMDMAVHTPASANVHRFRGRSCGGTSYRAGSERRSALCT